MHSRGIILKKHFPHRLRISVLDEHAGHISLIPHRWQGAGYACIGAMIGYELPEEPDRFVRHIELLSMPTYETAFTQLFLHHVLELCYFFLPVGSGQSEIFSLGSYLLGHFEDFATDYERQKIFVAKLLFSIGLYPVEVAQLSVSSSLTQPCDTLIKRGLTRRQASELVIFIYQCIKSHPYGRLLKTINFLSRVDQ